jgi:hypothetical protein
LLGLVGQITLWLLHEPAAECPDSEAESPAPKNSFSELLQYLRARAAVTAKFFSFVFTEIVDHVGIPPHRRGALRAIVTTREAGLRVGVSMSQRDLITWTNDTRRTVKSCGPGIPVLMPSRR